MATEQIVMAVIRASRPSFRRPHDKVTFAIHASFFAAGYVLTATGHPAFADDALTSPSTDEVSVDGWDQFEDTYAFVYSNPENGSKKVLVNSVFMNDRLYVDALSEGDSAPTHLEINVLEYVVENGGTNYNTQYKNLGKLVTCVDIEILSKLTGPSRSNPTTKPSSSEHKGSGADTDNPIGVDVEPRGSHPFHPSGMHIKPLRQARKLENAAMKKYMGDMNLKSGGGRKQRPLFSSQKKQLDEHFGTISQRVSLLKSEHEEFCGKHIRFPSSSSEDTSDTYDEEENKNENDSQNLCRLQSQNISNSNRVSSCPYPSVDEEMTRLGLKSEKISSTTPALAINESSSSSKRKRKSEILSCPAPAPAPHKLLKKDDFKSNLVKNNKEQKDMPGAKKKKKRFLSCLSDMNNVNLSLDHNSIRMFIMTWKEACRENNVIEVLERMLKFYRTRKRNKVKALFTCYPLVGLLNVAVMAIKTGMCDSMYDTLQTLNQKGLSDPHSEECTDNVSIEVGPSEKNAVVATKSNLTYRHVVSTEDILKKVSTYFEVDLDTLSKGCTSLEKNISFLRRLCKCEFWLAEQFSVEDFQSLGYGDIFTLLEKHMCLLPHALQRILSGETRASFEACMLQHQLDVLLVQASNSLPENENLSEWSITELLAKQFPSICFKLGRSGSLKDMQDIIKENKQIVSSKCVLFSATLFGKSCGSFSDQTLEIDELSTAIDRNTGVLGSVTTKDAIEALTKAPMLTDLESWSHWGLVFYPSFGPLLAWLLTEVNTKELQCLVTRDGKVVRIDHSATPDSFLEAFLQGSSFETAVHLLSLFALFGGECHVPLSLLKSHAQRAFKVFFKNSVEDEVSDCRKFSVRGKPLGRGDMIDVTASTSENKNRCGLDKAMPSAAKFTLDCLGYVPGEIRSFAAQLLLSGLQSVTRDVPSAILNECKLTEQRCMLHEIGLTLGIQEWINDYNTFLSTKSCGFTMYSGLPCSKDASLKCKADAMYKHKAEDKLPSSKGELNVSVTASWPNEKHKGDFTVNDNVMVSLTSTHNMVQFLEPDKHNTPDVVIETIRREEFGLDPSLLPLASHILEKQHARLGRALHRLSHELYSQDSHFLLELVQNADDNAYPGFVEPTLIFILTKEGIVVLNNELGFSVDNIKALCDIGNSTKKESTAGYIGKKGIGFKSVFRVSDAPEIHSNGFHIKFDISEGKIGFVLPTIVPPRDIDMFSRLVHGSTDEDADRWNTCIVLPFKSKFSEALAMDNIISMFSDLHPSLLLFLHRLRCIKFRNMVNDSFIVMRKQEMGDGIIKVSLGNKKMTWFVVSEKLDSRAIRPDVTMTEISIAFTLHDLGNESFIPHLDQQPVFAYLPLRTYGLKFIIQGDFVLPSSREEVDGDSPWNQWLLSEFPGLFVCAERSFCALPCFRENQGKAIAEFMSFVPLIGEVHGFFSSLPRMIISKLRRSNCLLLEGDSSDWVPPCKVLRNWNEQARALLPDSLLREHLGLGLLHKDTILSDSLARALGIEEYGPKILLQVISSLCCKENGLNSMGLSWLSSWLNAIYVMTVHAGQVMLKLSTESDILTKLRKIPFVPLANGYYGSLSEGSIWLHSEASSYATDDEYTPKTFSKLYANLRTVNPALFTAAVGSGVICSDASVVENITKMLYLVGVERLSAHEIVKVHILPAISSHRLSMEDKDMMIEYLSFVMFHLQSKCPNCSTEREQIISELRSKAHVLTNHGYKRPVEVAIHFSKDFGNPIDMNRLIGGIDMTWHEVDNTYLNHPITKSVNGATAMWRNFFQELGVTDFVQIVKIEKSVAGISHVLNLDRGMITSDSVAIDWESQELCYLLSQLTSSGDLKKCRYLLEVLDTLWDELFCDKVTGYCSIKSSRNIPFRSSLISSLHDVRWMASTMDDELHHPKDLFHDCEAVRSILGVTVPYAVPKVKSEKLLHDIGLKINVSLDDILSALQVWRTSQISFRASISQMSKLYTFISNEMSTSNPKILDNLSSGAFIFIPFSCDLTSEDVVSGVFFSPEEVYWHDLTGSVDLMKEICPSDGPDRTLSPYRRMLCNIYPNLHNFFVNKCGVHEIPLFRNYLQFLLQLSTVALPSQAAKIVFQVLRMWADGLKSGRLNNEDIEYLKENLQKMDFTVLPTVLDRWVSLHPSFGLVCWGDDEKLRKEFMHVDNVDYLYLGGLRDEEKEILQKKISVLMKQLGIHALSDVVTREAIYYGQAESGFRTSLINWVLPYAQRYIYKAYPDRYTQLRQSGFDDIRQIQIVVVKKLYYRNAIKRSDVSSKKRHECCCLLQDNVLYIAQESDSHSIFMELSRLLVDGDPELHLANFLHMITTMAESGSTEEQTDFFILNSQKVPKLPEEESIWTLSSALTSPKNNETPISSATGIDEPRNLNSRCSFGVNSNWLPADWKTAPGFGSAFANGSVSQPINSMQLQKDKNAEEIMGHTDLTTVEADADLPIDDESATEFTLTSRDAKSLGDKSNVKVLFDSVDLVTASGPNPSSFVPIERDQLSIGIPNPQQAMLTGRLGELIAFRYFSEKIGGASVKWVNETLETGLPYDIILGDEGTSREYIEVKATKSGKKDWFNITAREWQFAAEKGNLYSIARVALQGDYMAGLTIYKNPARLCQLGRLQLALVIPKQH